MTHLPQNCLEPEEHERAVTDRYYYLFALISAFLNFCVEQLNAINNENYYTMKKNYTPFCMEIRH